METEKKTEKFEKFEFEPEPKKLKGYRLLPQRVPLNLKPGSEARLTVTYFFPLPISARRTRRTLLGAPVVVRILERLSDGRYLAVVTETELVEFRQKEIIFEVPKPTPIYLA